MSRLVAHNRPVAIKLSNLNCLEPRCYVLQLNFHCQDHSLHLWEKTFSQLKKKLQFLYWMAFCVSQSSSGLKTIFSWLHFTFKLLRPFKDDIKRLEYPLPSAVGLSFWSFPPIPFSATCTDFQISCLPHSWFLLQCTLTRKCAWEANVLSPGMSENAWTLCLYLNPTPTRHRTPQISRLNSTSPQNVEEGHCFLVFGAVHAKFIGNLIIGSLQRLVFFFLDAFGTFSFFTATLKFHNHVSGRGLVFFHHAEYLVGRPFQSENSHLSAMREALSFLNI